LEIYNAVTKHKQLEPPWPEEILRDESIEEERSRSPTLSLDSKFIAHGDDEGNLYLWSRTKGLVANWQGYGYDNFRVDTVIFSPDGNLLLSVGTVRNSSSVIKIWDLANDNRCLREWTHTNVVISVAFSPDGKCVATAGERMDAVYLRNALDGTTARLIRPALEQIYTVLFSPDGRTLSVGGMREDGIGSVELWRLDSIDDTSVSLEGHRSRLAGGLSWPISGLAYCSNGRILAAAHGDNPMSNVHSPLPIKLWDFATNRCVQILKGHTYGVHSMSFTPDGNFLVSGGGDHTIRIWCLAKSNTNSYGKCIEIFKPRDIVSKVEFSRDGQMLLTSEGSRIRLRRMDTYTLESLQKERDDLMKVATDHLTQVLTENNIPFFPISGAFYLVDLVMEELDRNQRQVILTRYRPA
jgi:WD40 repeat protein